MVFIFIVILAFCLIASVAAYKGRYPRQQEKWVLIGLIIALAGIGACVAPKSTYDLFRHYEVIDRVRNSSYSLSSFLVDGYRITDLNYKYTYAFNFLIYIIAKFLPNQALPFITIVVTYSVFAYILFREFEEDKLGNRNVVISLSIFLVLMPYLYVYSNIRSSLAGGVIAFGIYRFYRDKKIILFVICGIIAVLIHPIAAAIIPFIFLSRIKPGIKGIAVTLLAPTALFPIMEYFRLKLGNDFLFRISAKYYNYTLVRTDNQGRVFLYSTIIMLIIISILAVVSHKERNTTWKDKQYSLMNLIIWYSMFSLGFYRNYEMITRLPYTIAILSPVVVKTLFDKSSTTSVIRQITGGVIEFLVLLLALLGLYENIAWML